MGYRDGLGQGWRVGAKALERMIDESSGDAHRWLDALLDLRDARTTLDATRAKLADLVRERDEARDKRAHETQHLLNCCAERDKALAASQAECARLRGAMLTGDELRKSAEAFDAWGHKSTAAALREMATKADAALASAPGSTDALREVCERVGEKAWVAGVEAYKAPPPEGITDRDGFNDYVLSSIKSIVSRILGERSDDAPQGRGERGKEGGDA